MRRLLVGVVSAAMCVAPACGMAQDLAAELNAMVAEPDVVRAHWGVMVTAMDGTPIYALNEGQFFQPASNAKLFTTAAAMALLGSGRTFETKVMADGPISADGMLKGDLRLVGGGDANLSGREFPYVAPVPGQRATPEADPLRYLAEMADEVIARGVKRIDGDVVGDDTYFVWEPYASDWAADDLMWGYGAPASALSVNDNQIKVRIAAGASERDHAVVTLEPDVPYYTIVNDAWSSNPYKNPIGLDRAMGSKVVHVFGGVARGAAVSEELAIEDPVEYAAIAFRRLLEARGVVVMGKTRAEHYDPGIVGSFLDESRRPDPGTRLLLNKNITAPAVCQAEMMSRSETKRMLLAKHVSPPLAQDVVWTNKESQNLHAEIMLRNVGERTSGTCNGSLRSGARAVREFLLNAGVSGDDFVFYDGSGLSGHDLVTPRSVAKLLQYAGTQPWFADWKASLPVGGVDGSLEHRFTDPPLKGHVFAKTGTLGEARALSGYVECASGRTAIFTILVDQHAPGTSADRAVMDRIVAAIAEAN